MSVAQKASDLSSLSENQHIELGKGLDHEQSKI